MQKNYQGQGEQGTGFLITCDKNREKQAVKDAFNFLAEYIQDIYGDIETSVIHNELDKQGKDHNLQNQIQTRVTLKNKLKILTSTQTNVNCLIFIKINERISNVKIDPVRVVNAIMEDVHKNDRELTRYCHKILPVERSFKAQHFKMLDQIDSMFQARDNSEVRSWALHFKCRNNSKFNYKQILGKTQEIAKKYGHFVDIYYPQWTVAVEIANHLMCLSIIEKYKQYDEYRLHKKGKNQPQSYLKGENMRQKKKQKQNDNQKMEKNKHDEQKNNNKQSKEHIKQQKHKITKQQDINNDNKIEKVNQNQEKQHKQQQNINNKSALLQQKIEANVDQDQVDFI